MRKMAVVLFSLLLVPSISAADDDTASAKAEAMLVKAVAYLKKHGRQTAISEFNNPKGQFSDKNIYVSVVDLTGKVLADSTHAKRIGKNISQYAVDDEVDREQNFFERVNDLIVVCSFYSG